MFAYLRARLLACLFAGFFATLVTAQSLSMQSAMILCDLSGTDGDAQQSGVGWPLGAWPSSVSAVGSKPRMQLMPSDIAVAVSQCGRSAQKHMILDDKITTRPAMQLDLVPRDARVASAVRAVSACVTKPASKPAKAKPATPKRKPKSAKTKVARRAASARAPQSAKATAARRGCFRQGTGAEYAKHLAFRQGWALVLPDGTWARHDGLQGLALPGLTAREVDLLHILWLVLEKRGCDPSAVDQAWLVCQSIHREGGPYPRNYFCGRLPGTPGFHVIAAASAGRACAPCVLPRGKLWLNARRRLASAAELLQLQGVNVPSSIPWWQHTDTQVLKSIAGNAFTVTVVACHCAIALLALASGGVMPTVLATARVGGAPGAAGAASGGTALPDFACLGQHIYRQLALSWPSCCGNVMAAQSISLGTLCSGGDFVVLVCRALAGALSSLAATPLSLVDAFACEADPNVRAFRERAVAGCLGPCWPDVHNLPLDSMGHCDLLVFGSSCKSLSLQNNSPRSLADVDASDPAASSGSTLHGCFSYVERHQPKIIIMENVTGLLRPVDRRGSLRNIDLVLSRLEALGYKHGHGVFDSRDFLVPQSRARVYVWAARPEYAPWVVSWNQLVALCRPRAQLSLSACCL